MRSTFALAALAGVTLAVPHYGSRPQNENVVWVVETIVETVTITDGAPEATYVPYAPEAPQAAATTPCETTPAYTPPAYTPAPAPQPQPVHSAPPAPPAPQPTDTGYMAIVNKYRGIMGKPAFTQDSALEANDLSCLQANPGQMQHILNAGSYGQVLAPGGPDDFLHVFVGGWLCEKPSLLGSDSGECDTQSSGWMYDGTGHADILSSDGYTRIGCQNYDGIWGCDVA